MLHDVMAAPPALTTAAAAAAAPGIRWESEAGLAEVQAAVSGSTSMPNNGNIVWR